MRIYAVNSSNEVRQVKFHLKPSLGTVRSGESYVLGDDQPVPDTEAMNSHDEPHRVGVKNQKVNVGGGEFEYGFTPFSVTLLELELQGKN